MGLATITTVTHLKDLKDFHNYPEVVHKKLIAEMWVSHALRDYPKGKKIQFEIFIDQSGDVEWWKEMETAAATAPPQDQIIDRKKKRPQDQVSLHPPQGDQPPPCGKYSYSQHPGFANQPRPVHVFSGLGSQDYYGPPRSAREGGITALYIDPPGRNCPGSHDTHGFESMYYGYNSASPHYGYSCPASSATRPLSDAHFSYDQHGVLI